MRTPPTIPHRQRVPRPKRRTLTRKRRHPLRPIRIHKTLTHAALPSSNATRNSRASIRRRPASCRNKNTYSSNANAAGSSTTRTRSNATRADRQAPCIRPLTTHPQNRDSEIPRMFFGVRRGCPSSQKGGPPGGLRQHSRSTSTHHHVAAACPAHLTLRQESSPRCQQGQGK
ncbi:hypothetical protein HNR14_000459 [Leifsonia naganoensis]|uniref:Uncharacterized protein n=1 Tax=Leifsonia naganoensis TaxID=150025 RepID=A0A853DJP5_9MICO|nr:hypothetical protein [Leifsonia naganoensis]